MLNAQFPGGDAQGRLDSSGRSLACRCRFAAGSLRPRSDEIRGLGGVEEVQRTNWGNTDIQGLVSRGECGRGA